MKYKHIAWDWNGTILNDGDASAAAVDKMLKRRKLGSLSLKEYQKRITFPVIKLYHEAGFDFKKERYEDMCDEFISNYKANKHLIAVHQKAPQILKEFKKRGFKQHIVSASEQGILLQQADEYGLIQYFDIILGQSDHQADSKLHLAKKLIAKTECNPQEVLFIGDTTHDFEVAKEAGFDCALIANGHCSKERLLTTGAPVFDTLEELVDSDILK